MNSMTAALAAVFFNRQLSGSVVPVFSRYIILPAAYRAF
jgi:hypothetical protein